jgi:class 3 adenylate cyclase/tetratricopeptide (TPR) repeat protein
MHCSSCRAEIAEASRFCAHCGAACAVKCARCGASSPADARYCIDCGSPLRKLVGNGDGPLPLGNAELKQATVLFADIVSSTELVAVLEPEDAMRRLHPAVVAMVEAVQRFDGTIGRTLGDGLMAVFGAPRAHEGHAALACQTALAMQKEVTRVRDGMLIRVGMHSGEILTAQDESPSRAGERALHGLTIHVASRIASIAEPGTIYVSEECFRLAREYFETEPLGPRLLKGIPAPVKVHRLIGAKPSASSDAFRSTPFATLRGREIELERLRRTLARVEDGQAKIVGIVAAPGTGKSRLCHEFTQWCRGRRVPVFETRAQLYGHATPLQPVLELLRSWILGLTPAADEQTLRDRIAARMKEVGTTFEADLPLLYEFLGVLPQGVALPGLNPRTRHSRLLDIVRHLVRHGAVTTSVILIEDLHWLDEASEDFVATLVDAVVGTKTMLLLNYRPSFSAPWMPSPDAEEIVLAELDAEHTFALVRELVGSGADVQPLVSQVAERSGGNPFFAEELVRSLVEYGVLVGEAKQYSLAADSPPTVLPSTVQAVIGARIDRLAGNQKNLLQLCSIIGKDVPLAVLGQVTDVAPKTLEQRLNLLCQGGFLRQRAAAGEAGYSFGHPLIQEVAFATQLKAHRAPRHGAVAIAMESLYGERLDEFAGLFAYHYEQSGDAFKAATYGAIAATRVSSTDTAQAIRHWKKVRSLMRELPRMQEHDALRVMANVQIAWLGWRDGLSFEESRSLLDEALAWARETGDSMLSLLLLVQGRISVANGSPADHYVDLVKEALSLVDPAHDPGRAASLWAALSHAYGWAGLLGEALAANSEAMRGMGRVSTFDTRFLGWDVEHWTLSLRGRLLARLGRLGEARDGLDRMLAIDRSRVDPTVRFIAHLGYIDVAAACNDLPLALQHAQHVTELARAYPSPYLRVFALACLATTRMIAGDAAQAIEHFSESVALLRASSAARESEPEVLAGLAEAYQLAGQLALADSTSREAISLAIVRTARLAECRASIVLARTLMAGLDPAGLREVDALLDRAAALVAETGGSIQGAALAQARAQRMTLASY